MVVALSTTRGFHTARSIQVSSSNFRGFAFQVPNAYVFSTNNLCLLIFYIAFDILQCFWLTWSSGQLNCLGWSAVFSYQTNSTANVTCTLVTGLSLGHRVSPPRCCFPTVHCLSQLRFVYRLQWRMLVYRCRISYCELCTLRADTMSVRFRLFILSWGEGMSVLTVTSCVSVVTDCY